MCLLGARGFIVCQAFAEVAEARHQKRILKGCSSVHRCDTPRGFTPWQASPFALAEAATTEEADFYVPSVVLILNIYYIYKYTER